MKDRDDRTHEPRKMVFLNCKSKDAAKTVCAALNRQKFGIGIEKYGYELQAVLKKDLRSVDWKLIANATTTTIQGEIADKFENVFVIHFPLRVLVAQDAFEGSAYEWSRLKVGDVLNVVAERLECYDETWAATRAVGQSLESSQGLSSVQRRRAEAMVLDAAEVTLSEVLAQNLKNKGWVNLKSIGSWFLVSQPIKEALEIVKTRYILVHVFILRIHAYTCYCMMYLRLYRQPVFKRIYMHFTFIYTSNTYTSDFKLT